MDFEPEGQVSEQQALQEVYLVTPSQVQEDAPAAAPQSHVLYFVGHLQFLYFPPQAVPTPCNGEVHFCKSPRQTHLSK